MTSGLKTEARRKDRQHSTAWDGAPPPRLPLGRSAHTPGQAAEEAAGLRRPLNHAWGPGAASRAELREEKRKDCSGRSPPSGTGRVVLNQAKNPDR